MKVNLYGRISEEGEWGLIYSSDDIDLVRDMRLKVMSAYNNENRHESEYLKFKITVESDK